MSGTAVEKISYEPYEAEDPSDDDKRVEAILRRYNQLRQDGSCGGTIALGAVPRGGSSVRDWYMSIGWQLAHCSRLGRKVMSRHLLRDPNSYESGFEYIGRELGVSALTAEAQHHLSVGILLDRMQRFGIPDDYREQ